VPSDLSQKNVERILRGGTRDTELLGMSIGGAILCILLDLLLSPFLCFLTAGRNDLHNLLHTTGGGIKEWLDLLLDRVLELSGLLVEGSVGGNDAAEFMDRSGQTVRNILEATLNLRGELVGAGLDLLKFGKHGVAELVDLRLGECIGGGSGINDFVSGERGPVAVKNLMSARTNRDKRFDGHQHVLTLDLFELVNRVTRQLPAKIARQGVSALILEFALGRCRLGLLDTILYMQLLDSTLDDVDDRREFLHEQGQNGEVSPGRIA